MRRNKTQTEVKTTKEKPINNLKTFYISMAFVGGLGVVICLGMCICRPFKRFVKLRFIDFSSKERWEKEDWERLLEVD